MRGNQLEVYFFYPPFRKDFDENAEKPYSKRAFQNGRK